MKLTMRAICLYEQLSDKSFYKVETKDDILTLVYAMFISQSHHNISLDVFKNLMDDKSVSKEVLKQYMDTMAFYEQFNKKEQVEEKELQEDKEPPKLSDAIYYLIGKGVDIKYVMDELELWQITPLITAINEREKSEMEKDRLWTFLRIAYTPFIDTKKLKSPSQIFEFPWEEDEKKHKQQDDYKKKEAAIRALLGLDKEEEHDGERRPEYNN